MPLETNLNTTPYWDDYNEDKAFHKILFKPGVAIQTRELNQLQTILQQQIERFGDHVFKSGTIVSGVNFSYNSLLSYIKIFDLQEDGQPVNVSDYTNLLIRNSANLQAAVIHYNSGFESKNPDLNTLYLVYTNSGDTFDKTAFSNNDVLEIFSSNNIIFDVDVNNGGLGFANSDTLHVISAVTVQVSSGNFTNGEIFTQATTGARQQIVGIANGTASNTKILSIKPLNVEQLANTSANSTSWSVSVGYNITGNTSSAVANVVSSIGSGATGSIITDSLGVVQNIVMVNNGIDYTTIPRVVIKPASSSASVSTLDLSARTYKAQIRVANSSFTDPVGYGYSFSVSEGVIYQKGAFSKVTPQFIIVSKYDQSPNNVSVGFSSDETVVKYTTDSTLYDNSANTYNEGAPGADRLRIKPRLVVVATNDGAANNEFLPLVEFSEGKPTKENKNTIYNELAKEFERRTFENSGNYVINSFRSTTKEITSNTSHFDVVVDPGTAYISGKRVVTVGNTIKDTTKANSVSSKVNQVITANYGNYVKVKELGGFFDFKSGAVVKLYDTAKTFLSSVVLPSTTVITPSGNEIGTARLRSLVYNDGAMGTPGAEYRMYLFDITMNAGKSFRDVKSFYFDGTYDGICDAILELDATTNSNVAVLYDTNNPDVIFNTGISAVSAISDVSYTYRTSVEDLSLSVGGVVTANAPTNKVLPYSDGTLSTQQKADFVIVPVSNTQSANLTGTVAGNTTSANLVGTSTTFVTDYIAGDYIAVYSNSSAYDVKRVVNVVNNTLLILNANLSFANSSTNSALFFPAYYPIDMLSRTARTIQINNGSNTFSANIATNLVSTANVIVSYNIRIPSASQVNKTVIRDAYVKIYTGNNVTVSASGNNTTGPWSLGIPDVLRLKNVYLGNTASSTDVTKHFYVNSYNDGDTVNNAELKLLPGSSLALSNTQWLLAKVDLFNSGYNEGYITVDSYGINDAGGFSNASSINTLEIPELLTSDGRYYDTRDCFDFRPYTSNTAAFSTTIVGATVNPSPTLTLSVDEKYIPVPDSQISFDVEFYNPRIDVVSVDKDANIKVTSGNPAVAPKVPAAPSDSIIINRLYVPAYPSLPAALSNTTFSILDKKVGNDVAIVNSRQRKYTTYNLNLATDSRSSTKRFTMSDISKIEKRVAQIENTLSLSLIEKSITDKVIPSSTDPSKNRFKSAFLVDDFNDNQVNDGSNLENRCLIDSTNSQLLPLSFVYNLESMFDRTDPATSNNITQDTTLILPYEEYAIVRQLNASVPVIPPVIVYEPEPATPAAYVEARGVEYTPEPPPVIVSVVTPPPVLQPVPNTYEAVTIVPTPVVVVPVVTVVTVPPVIVPEIVAPPAEVIVIEPVVVIVPEQTVIVGDPPVTVIDTGGLDGGDPSDGGGVSDSGTASDSGDGGGGGGGGGGDCFTPETLVTMADGSTKKISDVVIGDVVSNYDGTSFNIVTYIETLNATHHESLYTPSKEFEPFATCNHPLYIDGELSALDPVKTEQFYPWLGRTQQLNAFKEVATKDQLVYNLWLDGDGTYIVNGYGTTSIIGDGGWVKNAVHQGLLDHTQAMTLMGELSQPGVSHGSYVVNKLAGMLDVKLLNSVIANILTKPSSSLVRKALIGSLKVVDKVLTVLN